MAIDKPSLAALLAQSRKDTKPSDESVKVSSRPFMLKSPKSIVEELLGRKKPEPTVDEDETYLSSVLKPEAEVQAEPDAPVFEDEKPQEDDMKSRLKKIMEGQ